METVKACITVVVQIQSKNTEELNYSTKCLVWPIDHNINDNKNVTNG